MTNTGNRILIGALLLGALAVSGCELDLQDPNRPTDDEVFGDPDGARGLAIGLQAAYADEIRDPIWVVALVADELGVTPNVFSSYIALDAGEDITRGYYNTAAFDPWTGHFEVIKLADDVLRAASSNSQLTAGTSSGMIALGKLYRAMALGNLIQLYEQVPLDAGLDNPAAEFADRATVLSDVLQLLQEARQQIQTTPPSEAFYSQILAPGFDLENTINAMIARYALIAGNYPLALSAAQSVDRSVLSEFQFSANDPNPLWNLWYNSGNAYQMRPEQAFRMEAEAGDQRVSYWIVPDTIPGAVVRLDNLNQYRSATEALPVYFPDEMTLIEAEVYARTDQLEAARAALNEVRTQCTPSVAGEPVACLPALTDEQLATQQEILDEILRQRFYELYLQGLRYEDLRRFGMPLKYEWMPIPQAECDRNPSAPCSGS